MSIEIRDKVSELVPIKSAISEVKKLELEYLKLILDELVKLNSKT